MPAHPTDTTAGPSAPWLAFGFLLTGLGTVLLGPILPSIIADWHLLDSQAGVLLLAKFIGAFIGGVTVPRRLRFGILAGTILCAAGFGAFGLCHNLLTGSAALFIGGIGLGQIIASTNILAGHRYQAHTGSALASLNFFWSLGAVAAGLLIAALMPRFGLQNLLLSFAATFLLAGLGGYLTRPRSFLSFRSSQTLSFRSEAEESAFTAPAAAERITAHANPAPATNSQLTTDNLQLPSPIPRSLFLQFCALLFLYGGLETCLTGWLATYTIRYSGAHLLGGQSPTVLLWTALTFGRLLASIALRYIRESTAQRVGLALAFIFIGALATAHSPLALSIWCILLGLALAPFFPSTFAILMRRQPTARTAGFILAVSGLGAAAFPWLMGIVSTQTGSLRIAMTVPAALALALLAVSLTRTTHRSPDPA